VAQQATTAEPLKAAVAVEAVLVASGGALGHSGGCSDLWRHAVADATQLPLVVLPASATATLLGAAVLAQPHVAKHVAARLASHGEACPGHTGKPAAAAAAGPEVAVPAAACSVAAGSAAALLAAAVPGAAVVAARRQLAAHYGQLAREQGRLYAAVLGPTAPSY